MRLFGYGKRIPVEEAYPGLNEANETLSKSLIIKNSLEKTIKVFIASEKTVKIQAIRDLFQQNPHYSTGSYEFIGMKSSSGIAEQPIGLLHGRKGVHNRIQSVYQALKQQKQGKGKQEEEEAEEKEEFFIAAIENYFEIPEGKNPRDHAMIAIRLPSGEILEGVSDGVEISSNLFQLALEGSELSTDGSGYSQTVGSYLEKRFGMIGSDWFENILPEESLPFSRKDQILSSLKDHLWF